MLSRSFVCAHRYAQRSKESRLEWSAFTKEYFLKRETLANVLLLVDSSVPVQVGSLCQSFCWS
jgi:GTP-binding protein